MSFWTTPTDADITVARLAERKQAEHDAILDGYTKIARICVPFLTYVAGPYTSKTGGYEVQLQRFHALTMATVMLTNSKRWNCFSPITHSYPMHELGLGGDWDFWKKMDTEYLSASERIVIVTLDGWEQSTGVNAETQIAKEFGIPIWHMTEPVENDMGVWNAWLTDNHTGEYLSYYDEKYAKRAK